MWISFRCKSGGLVDHFWVQFNSSIFKLAVERLTKESKPTSSKIGNRLSVSQKVEIASEIFAKLLLSGSEGISVNDFSEDRIYPLYSSLLNSDSDIFCVLATRLFKPGDTVDLHRPVHKIVAEYCSADFLIKRIADPADNLTLSQCLSIIAPNSTVRADIDQTKTSFFYFEYSSLICHSVSYSLNFRGQYEIKNQTVRPSWHCSWRH